MSARTWFLTGLMTVLMGAIAIVVLTICLPIALIGAVFQAPVDDEMYWLDD